MHTGIIDASARTATAVYWHVGSKDSLIALAADQVWSEIARPDPDAAGWRAAAAAMATDLYETLIRHPWLAQAFGSQLLYGPSLFPPDLTAPAVPVIGDRQGSTGTLTSES